jgi:fibronectin-binding autotransporter adhesin
MRLPKYLQLTTLGSMMLATSLTSSQAQQANATWIGPTTGGEWNTSANWDIGVPAAGTNVLIGGGTNVNYNISMAAPSIGILTNNGVLNINAGGFNCLGIVMPNPSGGDKVFINSGGNVSVGGNFVLTTNASVTLAAGSTLTVNGAMDVSFGTSSHAAGTAALTNNGAAYSALSTVINNNQGTQNGLVVINGGTNNLGTTVIGRSSSGASFGTLGTEGLVVYNGFVTTTNLNVGNNGQGVSSLSAWINGGVTTNQGTLFINADTGGRGSRFIQSSGLFVTPDPGLVNPNGYAAGATPGSAVINIFSVTGGTNITGGFYLGNSNATALTTINMTNNAVIYVGSQGIASNGAATVNVSLGSGGLFGATAPWISTVPLKLASGLFTFQTADMTGTPNNIILSNTLSGAGGLAKTASGTLTLDGTNTYAGNTMIYAGTLAVGGTGTLSNSLDIFVGSGAIFDISQATGFAVNGSPAQTLSGSGTVNGAVNVASGGTVYPGSNTITGTLTLNNGLTETGGAINEFQLSGNPTGPNNDFLNTPGGLNVSGANTIQIASSGLQNGGVYPLIYYGSGGFSGSIANFSVSGATGSLSNSATAQTIYLVVQTAVRAATNLTWVGSVANNNWDTETTSNWVDSGSANKDYFVPQDNVLFGNGAATNVITVVGTPTPSAITVNTTTNYTLAGNGQIQGTGGITVSNGTLTVLTTNGFSGPIVLDGGVLSTPIVANSSSASGIGASSSTPNNFVFNGGTFNFTGGSASTDHGITLTNGGGTIDVSNTDILTLNGNIVGNGTLTVVDGGTLDLNNVNAYTNTTSIAGGVLELDNASGAGTGSINFSNATLVYYPHGGITVANPFNFVPGTTNALVISSGSGGNPISNGAWTGGGLLLITNTYSIYTVNGSLDGFTGTVSLDPMVAGNQFRFNSGGGNSSTGSTNATFDLGSGNAELTDRNGGIMNLGALKGGTNTEVLGQDADNGVTIWSIGWNNLSTTYYGVIMNNPGATTRVTGLTKVGIGTLTLVGGTETVTVGIVPSTLVTNFLQYTAPTIISNGVLALVVPDALTLSSNVTLASSSAVLDASQMGYVDPNSGLPVTNSVFEVVSGQGLSGIGTIRGFLVTDAGSTFNVGLPGSTGVMTVTNAVTLNGTTQLKINPSGTPTSDELISLASITNSGALIVTNIGGALPGGATFKLFNATSYVGTFGSVTLPTLQAGQTWNTANLYVNGTISVVGSGTPPRFSLITTSGNSIVLNATNGADNGQVTVLATTNLLMPLAQWSTLFTSNFDNSGNFTYTNTGALTSGKPQQFFILRVP